jgi:hypothetical protein
LARSSCQNKNAEETIADAAHVPPKRLKDHSSRTPGADQEGITNTVMSAPLAHNRTVTTPSIRFVREWSLVENSRASSIIACSYPRPPTYATSASYSHGVEQRTTYKLLLQRPLAPLAVLVIDDLEVGVKNSLFVSPPLATTRSPPM